MANSSFPILHGLVNSTHTSDVHAYYPTGNLPTPWPLVIISSLVSLVIAVIGFKSATITWNDPAEMESIKQNAAGKTWLVRYREAREVRTGQESPYHVSRQQQVALMREGEPPPDYELHEHEHEHQDEQVVPTPVPWRIFNMSTTHMVVILVSFVYSTARCAIALILSLKVLITKQGSHSASSSLLLLVLSIQTFITNRSIPRIMNMILILDSLVASIAFLIASFDRRGQYYGELKLSGGNCPVYMPDCSTQSSHWSQVGCGSIVYPDTSGEYTGCEKVNPNCGEAFYPPYGQSGDALAVKNVLFVMEMVIAVCGSVWLITVLITLYKSHNLFTGSWSDLFKPAGKEGPRTKTGSGRQRMGWRAVVVFSILGILGAILVTILTVAAHMAEELGSRKLVYSDGFGPTVGSDFVVGSKGNVSAGYRGESWTDCFVVKTPSSGNGFWDLWFRQNVQSAYRTAAAL
jgi:hypothetical protein